ncbi:MAG: hypothetical protein HC844_02820 [Tabrizicola sp.]|nr:hypothetical protein [Tabrizicola sp.]
MTYSTTADWALARAALDETSTPGAGPLSARPHVPGEAFWLRGEETRLAFARFVNMARASVAGRSKSSPMTPISRSAS